MQHKWTLQAHSQMSSSHSSSSRSCHIDEVDCWQSACGQRERQGEREREWESAAEIVALAGRKCCQRNRNVLPPLSQIPCPFSLLYMPLYFCCSPSFRSVILPSSTLAWSVATTKFCCLSPFFIFLAASCGCSEYGMRQERGRAAWQIDAWHCPALATDLNGFWTFVTAAYPTGRPFHLLLLALIVFAAAKHFDELLAMNDEVKSSMWPENIMLIVLWEQWANKLYSSIGKGKNMIISYHYQTSLSISCHLISSCRLQLISKIPEFKDLEISLLIAQHIILSKGRTQI